MTDPNTTEVQVTLLDVWRALESLDRSMNERFDRLERLFDAMSARFGGFETGIGAQLDALKAKLDEPRR
jgi:hypothetical protein